MTEDNFKALCWNQQLLLVKIQESEQNPRTLVITTHPPTGAIRFLTLRKTSIYVGKLETAILVLLQYTKIEDHQMDPIGFALALPFGDELSQPLKKGPFTLFFLKPQFWLLKLSIKWKPFKWTPSGVLSHFLWGLKFAGFKKKKR